SGARPGGLTISAGGPVGPRTVQLSGTGVNGPVVHFQASTFVGNEPIGSTSPPFALTITNAGNADLVFSSFSWPPAALSISRRAAQHKSLPRALVPQT